MIGRLMDAIADQGGLAKATRKIMRSPTRAVRAGLNVLVSSWPALALGDKRLWGALRQELKKTGYLHNRQQLLVERFAGLAGTTIRGRQVVPGQMPSLQLEMLYALVRARRPQIIVETGVCNGMSSAIILHALEKNGTGRLYSVDLPEFTNVARNTQAFWEGKGGAAVPADESPGWLVEAHLRHRWELVLGKSQDLLKPLLTRVGMIDMFIHDSEHSYANQMFEFKLGYDALRSGGVLVATDISCSPAFDEFWLEIARARARRAFVDANSVIVVKAG